MFRYAIRHEWLETNPAEGTKLRGSSRRSHDLVEANILAPFEIQAVLQAADPRWRVIILAAVLTGLREAELLGLAWGDIDWSARQIYVRQQYTAGRFSELKTKASRRRVDLPGELVAELRRWRLECPPGAHSSSRTARATRRTTAIYWPAVSTRRSGALGYGRSGFMISATPS
jgi:integrase